MLNRLIQASLKHRFMVVALTLMVMNDGLATIPRMDVDVLPDLNRPFVTIMTEAHGMAPEETEVLVSFPIETMMNGATGVQRRDPHPARDFSIVFVEFDWGTDIFRARHGQLEAPTGRGTPSRRFGRIARPHQFDHG